MRQSCLAIVLSLVDLFKSLAVKIGHITRKPNCKLCRCLNWPSAFAPFIEYVITCHLDNGHSFGDIVNGLFQKRRLINGVAYISYFKGF